MADLLPYGVYFRPELCIQRIAGIPGSAGASAPVITVFAEAAKWCSVLALAVWLSVARITSWRQDGKTNAADPPDDESASP